MLFPLESKALFLPTSAANRMKLSSDKVEPWFPKEAKHVQTFDLSSWKFFRQIVETQT